MSTAVLEKPEEGTLATFRRGIALSPELRPGLLGTMALALVAMCGRVAVPIAVQQGIDHGVRAPGGPNYMRLKALMPLLKSLATSGSPKIASKHDFP